MKLKSSPFFSAISGWWMAFSYIRTHRLQRFHFVGPIIFFGIWWSGSAFAQWLTQQVQAQLGEDLAAQRQAIPESEEWWGQASYWMSKSADWLIEWGIWLLVFWLKLKVTKYLLLTLMAPFMSAVAGKVRNIETGQSPPSSFAQFIRDIGRGMRTAVVLFFSEVGISLILGMAGLTVTLFAPALSVITSPVCLILGWIIGAYFYGAAVYDAVFEQAGLNWRQSLAKGWDNRGSLLGIGVVFSGFLTIPILGVILITLVGPIPATVAAARQHFSAS